MYIRPSHDNYVVRSKISCTQSVKHDLSSTSDRGEEGHQNTIYVLELGQQDRKAETCSDGICALNWFPR